MNGPILCRRTEVGECVKRILQYKLQGKYQLRRRNGRRKQHAY